MNNQIKCPHCGYPLARKNDNGTISIRVRRNKGKYTYYTTLQDSLIVSCSCSFSGLYNIVSGWVTTHDIIYEYQDNQKRCPEISDN